MIRSPAQIAGFLIQAAWRRRWLMIVPMLIMLPVGVVMSKVMPLKYVSRTLLMLQESAESAPLTREPANVQFVTNEERLAALRALLFSDAVMTGVLHDLGIMEPNTRAAKLRELRDTVWLDGAGRDFVEIFHSGPNPTGLGQELRTVVIRFLDALVSDETQPDALELLVQKHRRDLATQQATKTEMEAKLASIGSIGDTTPRAANRVADREGLKLRLANLDRDIEATRAQLERAEQRLQSARLSAAQGVLRAPELIRMIDPPLDPELPTRSPIMYLLAALAAGGLLGIALAAISEMLDTALRSPEEFAEVAGAPVIARIGRARTTY